MNQTLQLSSGCSAYLAVPEGGASVPGVIVAMEAFGLTAHIKDACDRLAAAGFAALAPDFYRGTIIGYNDMSQVMAMITKTSDELLVADMAAGFAALASQSQVDRTRLAALGFCMGGRAAFLAACRMPERVRAAVSLYGGGIAPLGVDRLGRRRPIADAAAIKAPLLLIYGGTDHSVSADARLATTASLSQLGKRHVLSLYPEAGHGFCCAERPSYHHASAEAAYSESFDFLARSLE